jgi:hypothetical protein
MGLLELLCYGDRSRTNGGWNILRIVYKKTVIQKKGGSIGKGPSHDVNDLAFIVPYSN